MVCENPTVSVILTTFNRVGFLKNAIDSVITQAFLDWELIVIDDGSTDDTAQVVKSYQEKDARIRYFFQINQGAPKARSRGVHLARGHYIAFF